MDSGFRNLTLAELNGTVILAGETSGANVSITMNTVFYSTNGAAFTKVTGLTFPTHAAGITILENKFVLLRFNSQGSFGLLSL